MNRALVQAQTRVGHDEFRIDDEADAEPGAGGAGAVRAVERECARLDLGETDAAPRAGELLGVDALLVGVRVEREHLAFAVAEGGLDGVDDAAALRFAVEHEPVDDDFDGVPALLVEFDGLVERPRLAVDADADEAGGAGVVEDVLVLALLVDDARSEEHQAGAALGEDGLRDLLRRLPLHGPAAAMAVRAPDAGEQEPQVVVDFSDGADGGARIVGDALLIDGDGGGEPLDVLDVGLVHASEELAGVSGEGLDVAALAFGVDRVEGEGGLA